MGRAEGRRGPQASAGSAAGRAAPGSTHPQVQLSRARHLARRAGLPSLRAEGVFGALREGIRAASSDVFRVVHFSVQSDHVHLMVEAADKEALALGARGLVVRLARAITAPWGGRGPYGGTGITPGRCGRRGRSGTAWFT